MFVKLDYSGNLINFGVRVSDLYVALSDMSGRSLDLSAFPISFPRDLPFTSI